jgi:hypothetical protein
MKQFKYFISILFVAFVLGCSEDNNGDTAFAENAAAPENISALFTISQDNTGNVTIAPHGEGIASFEVYYGDTTTEPAIVAPGGKTQHVYPEGNFGVKVVGVGINGKKTEVTLPLTVTFVAPENLEVTVTNVIGDPMKIEVSATADLETHFEVTFGDDPAAAPVQFNEGTTISHTYAAIGTYTVTVTALSGGSETTSVTREVIISNPLELPINFENSTLNYAFTVFGGAAASVVNNPSAGEGNTSSKVGKMTPAAGQTWTGGYLTLDNPLDMTNHFIKVKVWSPQAGVPVLLKLENLTNGAVSAEHTQYTSAASHWEELVYDFSGATGSYQKVVLFFNAANPGTGDSYYFDDISQSATGVTIGFPLTFEQSPALTWNNFGGALGSQVANPDRSGINTSMQVGRFLKTAGSQTWAGVAVPFDNVIDFSVQKKVKIKVWSPRANSPVLMKFENMNPHTTADDIERTVNTTVANQWEELTFDFTGIDNAKRYQQIVLFFNFNISGTGESYYFDDLKQSN